MGSDRTVAKDENLVTGQVARAMSDGSYSDRVGYNSVRSLIEVLAGFPISIYIEYYSPLRASYSTFIDYTICDRSLILGTKYILLYTRPA